jgi:hypothetical protein
MKKFLLASIFTIGAFSGFSQGTVGAFKDFISNPNGSACFGVDTFKKSDFPLQTEKTSTGTSIPDVFRGERNVDRTTDNIYFVFSNNTYLLFVP